MDGVNCVKLNKISFSIKLQKAVSSLKEDLEELKKDTKKDIQEVKKDTKELIQEVRTKN